jgi:hypothetical protein
MRRGIPCRTFRGWNLNATRRRRAAGGALRQFGSARSRFNFIQADGRAAWRAETMQIVCDFSAADGFRRDGHIDNRREAQRQSRRQTRPTRTLGDRLVTQVVAEVEAARGCPR